MDEGVEVMTTEFAVEAFAAALRAEVAEEIAQAILEQAKEIGHGVVLAGSIIGEAIVIDGRGAAYKAAEIAREHAVKP